MSLLLLCRRIIAATTARRVASAARPKRVVGVSEVVICHDDCLSMYVENIGVRLDVSYAPTAL